MIAIHRLLAAIWNRLRGFALWRVLWLLHDKFMIGVSGVVVDDQNRILLLRHRYRQADRAWGLPSGYANKGERVEETLGREVFEETGCRVAVTDLLQINSGFKLRFELYFLARHLAGEPIPDQREVVEARFFHPDELPAGLPIWHVKMIDQAFERLAISG